MHDTSCRNDWLMSVMIICTKLFFFSLIFEKRVDTVFTQFLEMTKKIRWQKQGARGEAFVWGGVERDCGIAPLLVHDNLDTMQCS